MTQEKQILFEKDELGRIIGRMAHEIVEKTDAPGTWALIGIRSRGAYLARRIGRKIEEISHRPVPIGALDISSFRDDRGRESPEAPASGSDIAFSIDEKTVVLIDDVIFRGRTIRAAMEAVARLGQPKRIIVGVLIDRGERELPIRADIVGKNIEAGEGRRVNVLLVESDGIDQVTVGPWQSRSAI